MKKNLLFFPSSGIWIQNGKYFLDFGFKMMNLKKGEKMYLKSKFPVFKNAFQLF